MKWNDPEAADAAVKLVRETLAKGDVREIEADVAEALTQVPVTRLVTCLAGFSAAAMQGLTASHGGNVDPDDLMQELVDGMDAP